MPLVPSPQLLCVFPYDQCPVRFNDGYRDVQLFRSLLGFAFPLFGAQMFAAMGEGGGNSVRFVIQLLRRKLSNPIYLQLLAGLSIVLGIPFPIFIYYKGEMLRARNPLTADSVKRTIVLQQRAMASMQNEKTSA